LKQVVQTLGTGEISVLEVPAPRARAGELLIATRASVISAGTERMLLNFGRASWLGKVRQQPEKARIVLDKVRAEGLLSTIEAVRGRLAEDIELGYSSVGVVLEVGEGVHGFAPGDRVASNGKHAGVVSVPAMLCARVPDDVSDEAAAFTVLGAIALQAVRLAQPSLGESFAVLGLGLVGLLTVQLLRAAGCNVLAADYSADRLALAESFGAHGVRLGNSDPVETALTFTGGRGVDGVIIAAATDSNEPIEHSARMSRKRGRIVLVGVSGLEISRADFYEKELTFQVSCSYGPGRYDPEYESKGHDYPVGFVRWTEGRNFEAVLDAMAEGRIDPSPLVSHRFPIAEAERAYDLIESSQPSLGVLLHYPQSGEASRAPLEVPVLPAGPAAAAFGLIGAGAQAMRVLLPALRAAGARARTVVSSSGVDARRAAERFGFDQAETDTAAILADTSIDCVVIATRHDSHAFLAKAALAAGKNVFVEKPLALFSNELDAVRDALAASRGARLMVGFNRRFSPLAVRMRSLLEGRSAPLSAIVTVNAGAVPASHWTHDPGRGGGRIVGEACHFLDLLRFLVGAPIASISAVPLRDARHSSLPPDCATLVIAFTDGSLGTVHYFSNGHRALPKERVEVFCQGRVLQLDNFRALRGSGFAGFRRQALWRPDKGHRACIEAFVRSVREGAPSPIPAEEIFEVSRAAIRAAAMLANASNDTGLGPGA
jgi:predicted dehydrogenase/threonine dehydrogenase-like Zn-dependent dehydrogenase